MQSFLIRCCLLALLAMGFVCTGDVGRVMRQVSRLVNTGPTTPEQVAAAATIAPVDTAGVRGAAGPSTPSAGVATVPLPLDPTTDPSGADAPIERAIGSPPTDGPAMVRIGDLVPGTRILVWTGGLGRRDPRHAVELIALDVVDPAVADVLEYRHVVSSAGGTSALPPRRVRITAGIVSVGRPLDRVPLTASETGGRLAYGTPTGPILALAVERHASQ